MPASQKRVRLMILFHRKKDMSFEDFDEYWRTKHAEAARSVEIFRKNIIKYEQFHTNPSSTQSWSDAGYAVADYDGIVILEAESEEKIREMFESQEYLEKLKPDEEKFSERTSFRIMVGGGVTAMDQEG